MGQEIPRSQFSRQDFQRFRERLQQETALLADWFQKDRLASISGIGGFRSKPGWWIAQADPRR